MGGLYIETSANVSLDDEVVVSFRVPVNAYALTVVRSRVSWINYKPATGGERGAEGFGVEFQEILGEGLNRLRFCELSGFVNGGDASA